MATMLATTPEAGPPSSTGSECSERSAHAWAGQGLQWMSSDEVAAITVPFAEISERLPAVMREFGVAVVEGVIVGAELDRLLATWQQDLRSLVDEEALAEAPAGVQQAFKQFLQEGP